MMNNSPIIIEVTRGESIESVHKGNVVIVDGGGEIIFSAGDPNYITCFRSSLKPFQASAIVLSGATESAGFSLEELALMCASHNGENTHVKTAQKMLDRLELTVDNYECGAHPAYDPKVRRRMIKRGTNYNAIHNNCSGKHAGMLCMAKHLSGDTKGYIRPDHPVQKLIFKQVVRIAGKKPHAMGIDGCGVPTPFYELRTIAKMFQKLGSANEHELAILHDAMVSHPHMVAGEKRFDTKFIETLKGRAISKGGGEAIQGIAIKTKKYGIIGMALKIIDGSHRARDVAIMATLNHLKLLSDFEKLKLQQHTNRPILNHNGFETGRIRAII